MKLQVWITECQFSVKIPKPEREIDLGEGDDKLGKFEVALGHPGRDLELNRQNQNSGLSWKSRCEIHLYRVEKPQSRLNFPGAIQSEIATN